MHDVLGELCYSSIMCKRYNSVNVATADIYLQQQWNTHQTKVDSLVGLLRPEYEGTAIIQNAEQCHIPVALNLQQHRCESLKSHIVTWTFTNNTLPRLCPLKSQ